MCETSREFFPNGGKVLAMATPWRKELHQSWFICFQNDIVEVGWDEVKNGGCGLSRAEKREGRKNEAENWRHFGVLVAERLLSCGINRCR